MLERKIKILIGMAKGNKDSYTSEEIQTFLNIKFIEGIYPYIRELKNFIKKIGKGKYKLIEHKDKIIDLKRIVSVYKENSDLLLDSKTNNLLLKFKNKEIMDENLFTDNNKKLIKEVMQKTHIIKEINEKGKKYYFICSYEEPVISLLNFFDIELDYSPDELKVSIKKYYTGLPNTDIPISEEEQAELRRLNVEYYVLEKDIILNKLKNLDFSFLVVTDELTKNKKKEFDNPFVFTTKLDNWKMQYVYNTDKIEGNALTLEEVKTILTIGSNSSETKKEVLETINSKTALERIFNTNNELTEDFIKKLHLAIQNGISNLAGEYKIKENCIRDNQGYLIDKTTPSSFVQERMSKLLRWYSENKDKLHVFVLATVFHNQFVYIHPFDDGNGRLARLLFNFILIKKGYFPIIFYNHDKEEYYSKLRFSKSGNIKEFLTYSLSLYRTQLEEF